MTTSSTTSWKWRTFSATGSLRSPPRSSARSESPEARARLSLAFEQPNVERGRDAWGGRRGRRKNRSPRLQSGDSGHPRYPEPASAGDRTISEVQEELDRLPRRHCVAIDARHRRTNLPPAEAGSRYGECLESPD